MDLLRSPPYGCILASMSMIEGGGDPGNVLEAVPGMVSRAVVGARDFTGLQAPWLQAGKVLREGLNGGFQTVRWLYNRPSHDCSDDLNQSAKPRRFPSHKAKHAFAQGVAYERKLDLVAAIGALSKAVELHPEDAAYISRLSKQWSDLGYIDGTSRQDAKQANLKALELAQKAVELDSQEVLGHVAMCTSKGRLACFSDNKTKVHLARQAEDCAKVALQVNPKSDLAHHLMGRWNYEMAGLNPLARVFVRIVYGAALSPGSYHNALSQFVVANKLAPHRVIHKVQLGKTLLKLGRKEAALEQLEAAMEMEIEDINDFLERREGERILNLVNGANSTRYQKRTPQRSGVPSFASMSCPRFGCSLC